MKSSKKKNLSKGKPSQKNEKPEKDKKLVKKSLSKYVN